MRDLKYFQTAARPSWAVMPREGMTWCTSCVFAGSEDGNEVMNGNASIVIDSVTCVWGQKIVVDAERKWLIVDGDKIDLPPECKVSSTSAPSASSVYVSAPPSASPAPAVFSSIPSSAPVFFQPSRQMPSSRPTTQISMVVLDNSYHPSGVSIKNISMTGVFTEAGFTMVKTGDVFFKSGERVSLQEYQNMSDEEREMRNNAEPAASHSMGV